MVITEPFPPGASVRHHQLRQLDGHASQHAIPGPDRPSVASFVERIRASEQFVSGLALVAEDSSGVIAHVMLSCVGVEGGSRPRIPDDAFMLKRLRGYTPELAGRIVYPAAFDALGY